MALTTRTFKGQLAVDSEDCSIDVWLVVKPHWREARKSVAHFVPPSRFICHFFYQADTPVTKRVRLEERPDQNELLLVDGALVVSEMQLQSLLEAGEFVRLPSAKILSFAQFCRVVAAKARVVAGKMTVPEFNNQLQLCMLADHADTVMNNSIMMYFWRKSFAHPYLTSTSNKYQGFMIPEMDWPLPVFRRTNKLIIKTEQLPVNDDSSVSAKEEPSKEPSVWTFPVEAKATKKEPIKSENGQSKAADRKRNSSRPTQTLTVKRRQFGTQTTFLKQKVSHRSTQTTTSAVSIPTKKTIPTKKSTPPAPTAMKQSMMAAQFLSQLSHLSALQANLSTAMPFPVFPLPSPFAVSGSSNLKNSPKVSPKLLNAGVSVSFHRIGIRPNGDVEVGAPEKVISMLATSLAPLPSSDGSFVSFHSHS